MAHLLIIDDEAPIRTSLREIWNTRDIAFQKLRRDGRGARRDQDQFDGIFCDVKMPQMDGLDVLDMLAKRACRRRWS